MRKVRMRDRLRKQYLKGISKGREIERRINDQNTADQNKTNTAVLRQRDNHYIGQINQLNRDHQSDMKQVRAQKMSEIKDLRMDHVIEVQALKDEIREMKVLHKQELKVRDDEIRRDRAENEKLRQEILEIKHWLCDKMELLKNFVSANRYLYEQSKDWRLKLRDALIKVEISEQDFRGLERDVLKLEKSFEKQGVYKGLT